MQTTDPDSSTRLAIAVTSDVVRALVLAPVGGPWGGWVGGWNATPAADTGTAFARRRRSRFVDPATLVVRFFYRVLPGFDMMGVQTFSRWCGLVMRDLGMIFPA